MLQQKTTINFSKLINQDNISDVNSKSKGLKGLLDMLELSSDDGVHIYQKEMYIALGIIASEIVEDLTAVGEGVEYMFKCLRVEV